MIHLSEKAFARLQLKAVAAARRPAITKYAQPHKPNGVGLAECNIAKQVTDFLEAHGWRIIRHNVALVTVESGRRFRVGEKGMADLQAVYYPGHCLGLMFWIETKREKNGKLNPQQLKWQTEERLRGALVLNVGHATNAQAISVEGFMGWYGANAGGMVALVKQGKGNISF